MKLSFLLLIEMLLGIALICRPAAAPSLSSCKFDGTKRGNCTQVLTTFCDKNCQCCQNSNSCNPNPTLYVKLPSECTKPTPSESTCIYDGRTYKIKQKWISKNCLKSCECLQLSDGTATPLCQNLCPQVQAACTNIDVFIITYRIPEPGTNCTCEKKACVPLNSTITKVMAGATVHFRCLYPTTFWRYGNSTLSTNKSLSWSRERYNLSSTGMTIMNAKKRDSGHYFCVDTHLQILHVDVVKGVENKRTRENKFKFSHIMIIVAVGILVVVFAVLLLCCVRYQRKKKKHSRADATSAVYQDLQIETQIQVYQILQSKGAGDMAENAVQGFGHPEGQYEIPQETINLFEQEKLRDEKADYDDVLEEKTKPDVPIQEPQVESNFYESISFDGHISAVTAPGEEEEEREDERRPGEIKKDENKLHSSISSENESGYYLQLT